MSHQDPLPPHGAEPQGALRRDPRYTHSSVVNGHRADTGWDPAPGHSSPMGKLPGGLCCTPVCPVLGAGSRAAGGHPPPRPSSPCSAPATWAELGLGAHSTHLVPPPATNRLLPARYLRARTGHTRDFSIPHGHRGSAQDGQGTAPQAPRQSIWPPPQGHAQLRAQLAAGMLIIHLVIALWLRSYCTLIGQLKSIISYQVHPMRINTQSRNICQGRGGCGELQRSSLHRGCPGLLPGSPAPGVPTGTTGLGTGQSRRRARGARAEHGHAERRARVRV